MKNYRVYFVLRGFMAVEAESADEAADSFYADKVLDDATKLLNREDTVEPVEVTTIEEVTS